MKKSQIVIYVVLFVIGILLIVISLYVKYFIKTVTFMDDDSKTILLETKIKKGEKVEKPENPQKKKATFSKWIVGENEYDFSNVINENTIINAKWIYNYDVTFKDQDGTELSPKQVINEGETAKKPDVVPSKKRNDFLGWNFDFENPIKNDINIEPNWQEYVKFNDSNSDLNSAYLNCSFEKKETIGTSYEEIKSLSKGSKITCMVSSGVMFSGQVKSISYVFDYGKGLKLLSKTNIKKENKNIHFPAIEKNGETFKTAYYYFEVVDTANTDELFVSATDIKVIVGLRTFFNNKRIEDTLNYNYIDDLEWKYNN